MVIIDGKSVYEGIAVGKIKFLSKTKDKVKRYKIQNIENEFKRLKDAVELSKQQLDELYKRAYKDVGEKNAEIFNIHHMMLEDRDFIESIENIIRHESVNCEYAVAVTGENFSKMFSSMDDDYMKERANDVLDITQRIILVLNNSSEKNSPDEASIIFADDLLPSETIRLDKSKVLAFVTKKGSVNSHTAILARNMNIPAVVGVGEFLLNPDGKTAIVDGFSGKVYIDPDDVTLNEMKRKQKKDIENKKLLENLKGKESITKDGRKINIFANIGGLSDVLPVLENDADGIGLFRSEFLYIDSDNYPSEETQFGIYKTVAQNMAGKKVIIRTLDIGADKNVDYFEIPKEENPALGYRAIRICLDRKNVFKTQLRAILRASAYGNISLMIPMIVSLEEIKKVRVIIKEIMDEFDENNIPYKKDIEIGVMIETPAAAIISDMLSKEVDFFSIGTNDLTQYTLACDRQNPKVEYLCEKPDISVLRLIEMTVKNAKKEGIWVGICGELAADLSLTEFFLDIGVDELSVSPSSVLKLRKKIREK